ncbi:hypothetical protein AVEN_139536-1, partial [Araneus ventricosus]
MQSRAFVSEMRGHGFETRFHPRFPCTQAGLEHVKSVEV